VLCSVTVLISAGEFSRLRGLTEPGGLLDVRMHRRGVLRVPGGFYSVITVQALCAVAVAVAAVSGVMLAIAIAAAALLSVSIALGLSLPWGRDGADEMTIIGTAATGVVAAGLAAHSHAVASAGAWFAAAVLCVSYFASGAAKLGGAAWRNGTALSLVMQTRSYGHCRVASVIGRYRYLGMAASYLMMIGEIAFPVALVTPEPMSVMVLACGAGFHVLTAIIVRLNRFVPAFLASYPLMLWVIQHR